MFFLGIRQKANVIVQLEFEPIHYNGTIQCITDSSTTLTKRLEKKLDGNYTVTCLPSQKLSKLDEPDMQDPAGEAGTSL